MRASPDPKKKNATRDVSRDAPSIYIGRNIHTPDRNVVAETRAFEPNA